MIALMTESPVDKNQSVWWFTAKHGEKLLNKRVTQPSMENNYTIR